MIQILGPDLSNDSIKDIPRKIAKMYVNEIFSGLKNKPAVTNFKNPFQYHTPFNRVTYPIYFFL
ncbi:hypothetical protein DHD80_19830 [Gramella sp. AN32]|nr:hypothetical protein [Gramella sp. AN32]